MRILVIPDVHLKPVMFDLADAIMDSGDVDMAIQMGDLVDDWGEEYNLSLYSRTLQRAIKFHEDHPNTLWVMGNHDYGYWHPNWGHRESGHSRFAEGEVLTLLKEMERKGAVQKIMHVVDGCIFTHAGLTLEWVQERTPANSHWDDELDFVYNLVNDATPEDLWQENSPIWARPQIDFYEMYPAKFQVVGHTPVRKPDIQDDLLISTDTFSTYHNGAPYGNKQFVIVDTEEETWEGANVV